jgi:hypothetical protein
MAIQVGFSSPSHGNSRSNSKAKIRKLASGLAIAIGMAAVGIVAVPNSTAIADDSDLPPSAPTIRDAPRGIVNANSEVRWAHPGSVYSDGSDASAGAPILIHDGNQWPLCFVNGEFSPFTEDC